MKRKLFPLLILILSLITTGQVYSQLQTINVGTSANDRTGDPLRTAFQKVNANFTYINSLKANLASPTFTGIPAVPIPLTTSDSTTQIANTAWVKQVVSELNIASSFAELTGNATDNASLSTALGLKVDKTTTVNGHALSSNVTVTESDILPSQTGNSGKVLQTNGSSTSWQSISESTAVTLSGTDTKTGTASPAISSYVTGQNFLVYNETSNTGAVTVNFNGVGAKSVVRNGSALASGNMTAGRFYVLAYDGTNFQIVTAFNFNPSRRLLYIKNLPDAVTGTTNETITDSFQIPAGTLQANDILNIMVTSTKSGTNAAATIRVKANTTAVLAGATTMATSAYPTASTVWNKFQREIIFRNSLSSQFAWSTTTSMANEITTNTTANTNLTIDFSTTQYIIVSIQPAGTLDTTKIESWYVEVIRN